MEIYSVFLGGLIGVAPYLVGWIAVIVLASLMLGRGGGKAERFLVAGGSLMLAKTLSVAFHQISGLCFNYDWSLKGDGINLASFRYLLLSTFS